jgi:hypothetical protein
VTTNAENARKFALDLTKFVKDDVASAVVKVHKQITLDILARLVNKSPVGNPSRWKVNLYGLKKKSKQRKFKGYIGGTFRGFWQTYAGSDPGTGSPPPPEGTRPRSASEARSAGAAAVRGLVPFSTTHIVNGLPYAERLNTGWSSQAPAGFFELAIAEAVNSARAQLETP